MGYTDYYSDKILEPEDYKLEDSYGKWTIIAIGFDIIFIGITIFEISFETEHIYKNLPLYILYTLVGLSFIVQFVLLYFIRYYKVYKFMKIYVNQFTKFKILMLIIMSCIFKMSYLINIFERFNYYYILILISIPMDWSNWEILSLILIEENEKYMTEVFKKNKYQHRGDKWNAHEINQRQSRTENNVINIKDNIYNNDIYYKALDNCISRNGLYKDLDYFNDII